MKRCYDLVSLYILYNVKKPLLRPIVSKLNHYVVIESKYYKNYQTFHLLKWEKAYKVEITFVFHNCVPRFLTFYFSARTGSNSVIFHRFRRFGGAGFGPKNKFKIRRTQSRNTNLISTLANFQHRNCPFLFLKMKTVTSFIWNFLCISETISTSRHHRIVTDKYIGHNLSGGFIFRGVKKSLNPVVFGVENS